MEVEHQEERQRFVVSGDSQESVLEYRLLPGGMIDFSRTFVPRTQRGRGIAEKLVRTGLAWARGQGFELTASCWYVQRFIERGHRHG